jgi:hypothetical protein
MSCIINLDGNEAKIQIEVIGYENPDAQDLSDANWLTCYVSLDIEKFTANFSASFTTNDFELFNNDLIRIVSDFVGSASFVTDEEKLYLNIEITKTGRACVKGLAQIHGKPKAALSFSFDTDQSFLRKTFHGVSAVLQNYPVKKGYPGT